jgi:hypothetical protein
MYGKLGHSNEAGSSTPKRVEALVGYSALTPLLVCVAFVRDFQRASSGVWAMVRKPIA